nr:D-erythronate dehydrogenase [Paracidobacterium acidisoli]
MITGGAGFLGARLAGILLQRGVIAKAPIRELWLADIHEPPLALQADPRVHAVSGDLLEQCRAWKGDRFDLVFHLAAAVSGECEDHFDLGMRSNFDTTRALLEFLRASGASPRLVFASSVAVFGADAALPLPAVVHDDTLPLPQSSYGIQKFMCEQLVADYTRRGFIDGRILRLMTVAIRPGKPNAAASGFLSGIIREPLHGQPAICPVALETPVALASPGRTMEALLAIAEADRESLGGRTAINMPALSVTVGEMLDALERVVGAEARSRVELRSDPRIGRIVGSWPSVIDSERGRRLGLTPDPDFDSVIRQFLSEDVGAR